MMQTKGSVSSMVIAIIAFVAAALSLWLSGSYVLTLLVIIMVIMIGKSLQPLFVGLWAKFTLKYFPLPDLYEFYQKQIYDEPGPDQDPPIMRGVRVLAMTEELALTEETTPIYFGMVAESLEALAQEFPLFKLRIEAAKRRNVPEQYVASLCRKDGEIMRKCFSAWLKSPAVMDMPARTQNKDLFLHDGEVPDPQGGESIRYTVMVLFDSTLPLTLPKQEPPKASV